MSTNLHHHSPGAASQPPAGQAPHMVLDRPLSSTASHSNSAHTNTSDLSSGDTSSASSQKMDENHQFHTSATPNKQIKRLADGVERSRSPQSAYSAKLAQKQTNNSVYYYSDTLKKEDKVNTRVMLHDSKKNAQGSTLV